MRWGLYVMSSAQDVRFSEERLAQGQQLTNKLWNAARLILTRDLDRMRRPDAQAGRGRGPLDPLAPGARPGAEIDRRIESYDFAHAALALYDFVYGELCDWYLELVKPRLRAGEPELQATLLHVLTQTLAIAHPMIPFVTEEIYRYIPGHRGPAGGGPSGRARPRRSTRAPRPAWRASSRPSRRCAGGGTSPGCAAAATVPARLAAEGYEETGEHVARLARLSFTADGAEPVATVPVPGGAVEILPSDDVDAGGRPAPAGRPPGQARG